MPQSVAAQQGELDEPLKCVLSQNQGVIPTLNAFAGLEQGFITSLVFSIAYGFDWCSAIKKSNKRSALAAGTAYTVVFHRAAMIFSSGSNTWRRVGIIFFIRTSPQPDGNYEPSSFALSTFTMGFAIASIWVPAQTMSQQETPPAMMGRVSSSFMSLIALAQVLGLMLSGYLAQKLGIRPLFISSAGVLALLSAAGYAMMRGRPMAAMPAPAPQSLSRSTD